MQPVILALLGCCVVAHSASLSDTLGVSRAVEEEPKEVETLAVAESDAPLLEVSEIMEDNLRSKRSGGGSGGFLAGIGNAILGKVASASSGSSSGSSLDSNGAKDLHQYEEVEYGAPVYGHDDKNFDIWSFKKAILNTLFQALKAIGGGVIALKGKLIHGGGVIVSTKGRLISAKGDAITNLGRQIVASASLSPPKHQVQTSYVYETPTVHVPAAVGHESYGGEPSTGFGIHGGYSTGVSSDSYGHSGYAAPSEQAVHPGLLILKSFGSGGNFHETYKNKIGAFFARSSSPAAVVSKLSGGSGGHLHKHVGKFGGLVEGISGASKSSSALKKEKLGIQQVNHNVGGHSLGGHVELQHGPQQSFVKEPLHLPIESHGPIQFSGGAGAEHVQFDHQNEQQQQHFASPEGYADVNVNVNGNNNYQLQSSHPFSDLKLSNGPMEISILQSPQSSNYPQHQNYLSPDYHGAVKRSSLSNSEFTIEPSIGYVIENSRARRA